jgi:glutathione S-transferase
MGRYAAKMVGLYPEDALQAAFVDDSVDGIDELGPMVNGAGKGLEQADKEAARVEEVTKGKTKAVLDTLEASIQSLGDGAGHSVGNTLTFADIVIFTTTVNTFCGFFDGLSVDMLKDWPAIQSVNKTVSNHPAVRKYYDEGNGSKLAGMWTAEIRAAFISARD